MNLNQHDNRELVFFVRNSSTLVEKGNSTIENTFENYKKGLADKSICRTISVSGYPLNLSVLKASYPYIECVRVPENYELTVEQVNNEINKGVIKAKTTEQKLQEMEQIIAKIQEENEKLNAELQQKNVISKKK